MRVSLRGRSALQKSIDIWRLWKLIQGTISVLVYEAFHTDLFIHDPKEQGMNTGVLNAMGCK